MLNCSLRHQFSHHMHNYTDTAFKTPGRLRSLICIHALYNTRLSFLAVNPLFFVFCIDSALFSYRSPLMHSTFISSARYIFISITYFLLPAAQLNFLIAESKHWIEKIGGGVSYPCGVTPEKNLLILQLLCFRFRSLHRDSWVEFLLGNFETKGQTGATRGRMWMCNSRRKFRHEKWISRHR